MRDTPVSCQYPRSFNSSGLIYFFCCGDFIRAIIRHPTLALSSHIPQKRLTLLQYFFQFVFEVITKHSAGDGLTHFRALRFVMTQSPPSSTDCRTTSSTCSSATAAKPPGYLPRSIRVLHRRANGALPDLGGDQAAACDRAPTRNHHGEMFGVVFSNHLGRPLDQIRHKTLLMQLPNTSITASAATPTAVATAGLKEPTETESASTPITTSRLGSRPRARASSTEGGGAEGMTRRQASARQECSRRRQS